MSGPTIEVHEPDELATRAAAVVADTLLAAAAERGVATLAVSGGSTPAPMFTARAGLGLPWERIHVLQVDERVAPDGDEDRNLTDLRTTLLDPAAVPDDRVHAMPVTTGTTDEVALAYAATLDEVTGGTRVLDVVHLGLGDDGHTASLVPGDPAVAVRDRPVAATGEYQGRRRVTLTVPVLRAARCQLWLVAGAGKADALARLRDADPSIPASAVLADTARVLADRPAVSG